MVFSRLAFPFNHLRECEAKVRVLGQPVRLFFDTYSGTAVRMWDTNNLGTMRALKITDDFLRRLRLRGKL